jgi:hypothetical protein
MKREYRISKETSPTKTPIKANENKKHTHRHYMMKI